MIKNPTGIIFFFCMSGCFSVKLLEAERQSKGHGLLPKLLKYLPGVCVCSHVFTCILIKQIRKGLGSVVLLGGGGALPQVASWWAHLVPGPGPAPHC